MFWTVALSDYHNATSRTAGHYPVGYPGSLDMFMDILNFSEYLSNLVLQGIKQLGIQESFEMINEMQWIVPFFFGVTATAPSRDLTDNKKKRREGSSRGESKRKLLKETQNQGKETRKKKRTQVEYRVEGAQDRRRRRKPGGWKETPNTRKRGGESPCISKQVL